MCDTDYLSGNELPIDANAFAFVVSEHELNGCESKFIVPSLMDKRMEGSFQLTRVLGQGGDDAAA